MEKVMMNRKKTRKITGQLRLDHETVRVLSVKDLGGVAGGCDTTSVTTEAKASGDPACSRGQTCGLVLLIAILGMSVPSTGCLTYESGSTAYESTAESFIQSVPAPNEVADCGPSDDISTCGGGTGGGGTGGGGTGGSGAGCPTTCVIGEQCESCGPGYFCQQSDWPDFHTCQWRPTDETPDPQAHKPDLGLAAAKSDPSFP
jgi:hypothetical protein